MTNRAATQVEGGSGIASQLFKFYAYASGAQAYLSAPSLTADAVSLHRSTRGRPFSLYQDSQRSLALRGPTGCFLPQAGEALDSEQRQVVSAEQVTVADCRWDSAADIPSYQCLTAPQCEYTGEAEPSVVVALEVACKAASEPASAMPQKEEECKERGALEAEVEQEMRLSEWLKGDPGEGVDDYPFIWSQKMCTKVEVSSEVLSSSSPDSDRTRRGAFPVYMPVAHRKFAADLT